MIARGFKPVAWVAAVGASALGCYMLSLNVASERADLARVERQIVAAKQDIRTLQTELGTRGRMAQLENWNADVLALSAPASKQFLQNEFKLASYSQPVRTLDESAAQVRMASADAVQPQPQPRTAVAGTFQADPSAPARPMVHQASLLTGHAKTAEAPSARPVVPKPASPRLASAEKPSVKPKPAPAKPPAKASLIDDNLLGEIGAAARAERKSGGAGGQ